MILSAERCNLLQLYNLFCSVTFNLGHSLDALHHSSGAKRPYELFYLYMAHSSNAYVR